ncbi:MAG: PqqD family peptide modification chaperone [Actinobacteria bacterium]|nr:PqqD family peptide modification chaperone [Actinomycetota bacterium]
MPVDRPTFSESWYRVADLRPRLRSTVQIHRQYFRGQMWHVVQDPTNNQFFRLNDSAYHFVALLDGQRCVSEVWYICNEELADSAPTQGEVIQLLGQLYAANLLQAELPPDAEGLFNRYRKRIKREVQGHLTNLLFVRIPLFDPDHFLDRWVGVFGNIFSWYGLAVWLVLVGTGLYFVAGRVGDMASRAGGILDPANLPYLYLSFIFVKICHEFGHSFACKKFGRSDGSGGEVHVMGIMLLVFMPMPYMDATSAWAFRKGRTRAAVAASGMYVELAIAAVAAMIWAKTASPIAYNVMFIASVSTLLFNANPLLRYDGYYILSDWLEIANLAPRSRQYIYYLVKRYVWGVGRAQNPAHTPGEKFWLPVYGISSTLFRVFIVTKILLFVAGKLFIVGVILALAAVVAWVFVPLGKFLHYLGTSGELARVRLRAVVSTAAMVAGIAIIIGLIPAADRGRIEGVVEPSRLAIVHMAADGFVTDFMSSEQKVSPDGPPLLKAQNPDLETQLEQLEARREQLRVQKRLAQTREVAGTQILSKQIAALEEQIQRVEDQLRSLELHSPLESEGIWIAPNIERFKGAFIRRGDRVGLVASLDDLFIRATAGQEVAARLIAEAKGKYGTVEIRVKGRPDMELRGNIEKILPAGQERLPSAALGYAMGGSMATEPGDEKGIKTAARFFEIHIEPIVSEGAENRENVRLFSGQRVIVRFETPPKPLMVQWYRSLLQMLQRRFHI